MTRPKPTIEVKPRYLSQHDAEIYCGCSRDKLARMRNNGLKVFQDEPNGIVLYDTQEIDAYFAKYTN